MTFNKTYGIGYFFPVKLLPTVLTAMYFQNASPSPRKSSNNEPANGFEFYTQQALGKFPLLLLILFLIKKGPKSRRIGP